jgi:beta-lactam-binding protein with PASTA domain
MLTVCIILSGCPSKKNLVAVPNVTGQTQAEASSMLAGASLITGTVTQQYSSIVAMGLVISQSPDSGTSVSPGSVVDLIVSNGPQPVMVPDVVGQTQTAASADIIGAGLMVGMITQAYSSTMAAGLVISQSPDSGTSVRPGSAVALVVSLGPQPVPASVPDVVGQTEGAASAAVTSAGFISATTSQCSSTIPTGTVIGQTPAGGAETLPGSPIALEVSSGACVEGFDVEMVPVPAGTFTMGNSGVGDDAAFGNEAPMHPVKLNTYEIGKYDVTSKQYCAVLNWALVRGYLKDSTGVTWAGAGDIYAGENLQMILSYTGWSCNVQYSGTVFSSKTRTGLPAGTIYSMDTHPIVYVSWYGAVAFCNWLSEMEGLPVCYDTTTEDWSLIIAPPKPGGYRLPTEAEWERAAAWDGTKHWIYGFTSDTLTGNHQCNYNTGTTWNANHVDPLGLNEPCTSPVGWFDGVNVSPNGNVATVNSVSPVGAYDMSGNVFEWCNDWWMGDYYIGGSMTNPTGPPSSEAGLSHVVRGGSCYSSRDECRSACRPCLDFPPLNGNISDVGFRLAKS